MTSSSSVTNLFRVVKVVGICAGPFRRAPLNSIKI